MKKLIFFLFLISAAFLSHAQSLQISAGAEFTVKTPQVQLTGGYVTKSHWAMGVFYQKSGLTPRYTDAAVTGKQEFYGLYVSAPIYSCEKVNLAFQLRSGISEGRFVAIVPSIESTLNISRFIGVGLSTSVRYTYPSFAIKTFFRPFNGHHK